MVNHLSIFGSDHTPIILDTMIPVNNNNYHSFKFEADWLLDKEYVSLVKSTWSNYIKNWKFREE